MEVGEWGDGVNEWGDGVGGWGMGVRLLGDSKH